MDKTIISLQNVEKVYGTNRVVHNLSIDVFVGEFLTLLGPSGCGKTSTLRMIAGFEAVTSGRILFEGESMENKEPYHRNLNTVFQSYSLFPHMNVYDNIAYGLQVKKFPKSEIKRKVTEMLDLVQLPGFENKMPDQMSGGQKQRVAISRALVNEPKVLLLDEPLGAMDLQLRKQMQIELKQLQRRLGITFIYVTHDQEEALIMSDRIAVMNQGRLEQISTPNKIYNMPDTQFVAKFIGESNILSGKVISMEENFTLINTPSGTLRIKSESFQSGENICICNRPENLKYSSEPVEGFSLIGVVKEHIYVGSLFKTIFQMQDGSEMKSCNFSESHRPEIGQKVFLYWNEAGAVAIRR